MFFTISFISCQQATKISDKDLEGRWILKKTVSYINGKENVFVTPKSKPGGPDYMWGTMEDPIIVEFTKHKEVIMGRVSQIEKKPSTSVHQYTIENDSMTVSGVAFHIAKASKDTLVMSNEMKVEWFDKPVPHGKEIYTFYYTR